MHGSTGSRSLSPRRCARAARRSSLPLAATLAVIAGLSTTALAQVDIRPVVTSGEPAPGIAGDVIFSPPLILNTFDGDPFGFAIADDGTVVFRAPVSGEPIETNNDFAVWTAAPGNDPELVIRESDPAPGLDAAVEMDQISFTSVSPSGRVLIASTVRGPGITFSNFVGLWTFRGGVFDTPLRTEDPAPDTDNGVVFQTFDRLPTQNPAGRLALPAGITGTGVTPDNRQGVWTGPTPDATTLAWRTGDALPGEDAMFAPVLPPLGFGVPVVEGSGRVVALRPLSGPSVDDTNDLAIVARNSPGAGVETILRTGDLAPDGSTVVDLSPPVTSTGDATAFLATLEEQPRGTDPDSMALLVSRGMNLETRLETGSSLPNGGSVDAITGVSVNNAGDVAALVSDDGVSTIWTDAGGPPSIAAREGDSVPGMEGVSFGPLGRPIVTDSGRVVFAADDAGSSTTGVYLYSPLNGSLTTLIREGQVVDVNRDGAGPDLRTILTLVFDDAGPEVSVNATGAAAVRVGYEEGGASILVAALGDCRADFDGSGTVNVFDIIVFLEAWSNGLDFNMDGQSNVFDIIDFLGVWDGGCP